MNWKHGTMVIYYLYGSISHKQMHYVVHVHYTYYKWNTGNKEGTTCQKKEDTAYNHVFE